MKRSSSIWTEERPFPMDIEYLVQDTLETVRPKLRTAQSYEEAQQEAAKLDEEFRAKLGGWTFCANNSLCSFLGGKESDRQIYDFA